MYIHLYELQNLLNVSTVADYPRFNYRGLMIDCARHYLPVDVIRDVIVSGTLRQSFHS